MSNRIQILSTKIKLLRDATEITKLSKGFSPDEKYTFMDNAGNKYLLRISDIERYDRKKSEFKVLRDIRKYNVFSPEPIELGMLEELDICFGIFSYVEGEDAKSCMHTLNLQEQYEIGIEAGKELSRIHLHPAPKHIKSWQERIIHKHKRYLEEYKKCGIKIKNDDKILAFIESNYHHINNRPNQLQHDDFHLENIILKDKKYAGVIDFDNYDWGDPYHDFVKVALASRVDSVPFSIGQIDGYFNHEIPEAFWRLYSVYTAMLIFSSIVWSIKKSPTQLDKFIERAQIILDDHKNFELLKPTWYASNIT